MLNPKQIGLLRAFIAAGVEYAVVGGMAVNAHGYTRATIDLDVFIRPTESSARAVYQALLDLGAPVQSMSWSDLLDDEENLRLGSADNHVDILSSIGEMRFDQVWRNRVHVVLDGLEVAFISRDDLIENKRQVGRLIDLADVEALERLRDLADRP